MKVRRYLRAYFFDRAGKALPPFLKTAKVSTAILPVMKLPGMKCYASQLVLAGADALRSAAVDVLIKTPAKIQGVSLVVCVHSESRRIRRFVASFAAFGRDHAYPVFSHESEQR